jgi:hypothetical protein
MEGSYIVCAMPGKGNISFRRTPEERNGGRVLTRNETSSILKRGTYTYYICKNETITQPLARD